MFCRRRHASQVFQRAQELKQWHSLQPSRNAFRGLVYAIVIATSAMVTFVDLVYIACFSSGEALMLVWGMVAVVLYGESHAAVGGAVVCSACDGRVAVELPVLVAVIPDDDLPLFCAPPFSRMRTCRLLPV